MSQEDHIWFEVRKEPIQGDQTVVKKMDAAISKNFKINDSLYIYSNSYQALCCFYIFAFGKQKKIKNSDKMFPLVEKEQRVQVEKNCFQKFNLNLNKDTPLIWNLSNIQNKLNSNKFLLKQASQGLNEKDSIAGVRSLANQLRLGTYECNQQNIPPIYNDKESKNAILIGKNKNKPLLFIFSQFQPQNQKEEEISSILKSSKLRFSNTSSEDIKSSKLQRFSNTSSEDIKSSKLQRISNTSSEDAEDQQKNPNKKKIKQSRTQISISQIKEKELEQVHNGQGNAEALESNQFTWFQGIILTIIILALLSHFFGIFDEQIKGYNEKNNGQYYLIQTGYTIVKYISILSEKIFS